MYGPLQMNALMESCFGKSAVSGAMGFAMGGVFGLFMASVRLSLPPRPVPHPILATATARLPLCSLR